MSNRLQPFTATQPNFRSPAVSVVFVAAQKMKRESTRDGQKFSSLRQVGGWANLFFNARAGEKEKKKLWFLCSLRAAQSSGIYSPIFIPPTHHHHHHQAPHTTAGARHHDGASNYFQFPEPHNQAPPPLQPKTYRLRRNSLAPADGCGISPPPLLPVKTTTSKVGLFLLLERKAMLKLSFRFRDVPAARALKFSHRLSSFQL